MDNCGVNHYKMGFAALNVDSEAKTKKVTTVFTTNRAKTTYIPGEDPIQTNAILAPPFWNKVKDIPVDVAKSCFENIYGHLNSTLPGNPSLSDHYLSSVSIFF